MTRAVSLALLVMAALSCAAESVEPRVMIDESGCSPSEVSQWPTSESIDIIVTNNSSQPTAVVMGEYSEGYGHDDLTGYGEDVSTRPHFIEALEVFQVDPESQDVLSFDHGRGTFFMVCMPDPNTMVVLDDVITSN